MKNISLHTVQYIFSGIVFGFVLLLFQPAPGSCQAANKLSQQTAGSVSAQINQLIDHSQNYVYTARDSAKLLGVQARRVAESQGDSEMISYALNNLGLIHYRWNEQDSAQYYLENAISLSEQIGDSLALGIAINRLGNVYWALERQGEAKANYERAREIHRRLNNDKEIGRAENNLANVYREWGEYQQAIDLYLKAVDHYEKAHFREGVAWLNFSLTILYKKLENYEKALKAINQSLGIYTDLAQETGDSTGIMICYGQLGDIYNYLGELERGLDYHLRALDLRRKTGVKPAIADGLSGVGQAYFKLGENTKAQKYFEESLRYRRESGSRRGVETIYKYLGYIAQERGQITRALEYLSTGLEIAREINQRFSESEILQRMASIHAQRGEYEQAWALNTQHRTIQDSLFNTQISKRIASVQLQHQIEEQAIENDRLQRENEIKDLQLARSRTQRTLLILLALLVIGAIGAVIYFYQKKLQIRTLRGLIPICANCKSIRNDKGYYEHVEEYLSSHSDVQFSHGICDDCARELYPDYMKKKNGAEVTEG